MKSCKEYLVPDNGGYKVALQDAGLPIAEDWIEILEGAEALTKEVVGSEEMLLWWRDNFSKCIGYDNHLSNHEIDVCNHLERNPKPVILWQRDQDEPFLTPKTTLNDQYAEIEQARQTIKASWPSLDMQRIENVAKAAKAVADSWPSIVAGAKANTEIHGTAKAKPDFNFGAAQAIKVNSGSDSDHAIDAMSFVLMGAGTASGGAKDNVNHPSHYTQGKVECIDALESATIGKSGIEAVCVANVIKYLWRYEEKNGLEDVKKAQFYLNRLIATLENNNG